MDPTARAVEVCLSLPAKQYDDLYSKAKSAGISVPELLRRTAGITRPRIKPYGIIPRS